MTRRRTRLRCLPWPALSADVAGRGPVTTRRDGRPRSRQPVRGGATELSPRPCELDPKFGIGYQGLAGVSSNLGKQQDAEKYIKEALRHLDGMTERERYTTRAGVLH